MSFFAPFEKTNNIYKNRDANTCADWINRYKTFGFCDINVKRNPYGNCVVNGKLKGELLQLSYQQETYLKFWAPNSPNINCSFSGSGIPYPTEEIAYENTDNYGAILVRDGQFTFTMKCPSGYYMGTKYNPPLVKIRFTDRYNNDVSNIYTIVLDCDMPNRKYLSNGQPMKLKVSEIKSQEDILRNNAYPFPLAQNFSS